MKKDLKKVVEEIEDFSEVFRDSNNEYTRKAYNQYIELIILEAPESEQYNLCNYWSRLTR